MNHEFGTMRNEELIRFLLPFCIKDQITTFLTTVSLGRDVATRDANSNKFYSFLYSLFIFLYIFIFYMYLFLFYYHMIFAFYYYEFPRRRSLIGTEWDTKSYDLY